MSRDPAPDAVHRRLLEVSSRRLDRTSDAHAVPVRGRKSDRPAPAVGKRQHARALDLEGEETDRILHPGQHRGAVRRAGLDLRARKVRNEGAADDASRDLFAARTRRAEVAERRRYEIRGPAEDGGSWMSTRSSSAARRVGRIAWRIRRIAVAR